MKKLLFLFVVITLFTSCEKIHRGVVVERWYEPARYYTTVIFVKCGKYSTCPIVQTHFDDEDYMVKVSDVEDGKQILEDEKLTKDAWEFVQVGDSFFRDTLGHEFFRHNPDSIHIRH